MGAIQLYQYVAGVVDGKPIQLGSLSEARSITLAEDEVLQQTHKVAPTTAVKVFDSSELETLGGFSFLWLESDLDLLVQFTTGVGVTDAYDVKTLKGSGTSGVMGPAILLGSNVTQILDGSVDAFDGTAGTLGEVWVYNEDASDTARVHVVAAI